MTTAEIAFFQGQYVPIEQANVNIKTSAFLYGTSIFEGIRGYWNEAHETTYLLRAREHFERMLVNCKLIHLDPNYTLEQLMDISQQLVLQNNFRQDLYLQPRFYKSGLKVPPYLDNVETDYCCFTMPFGPYLDTNRGLKVCVSNWRRISDNAIPPRGKIGGAYVNSALAATDAHLNGFDDAIVLSEEGLVTEGSGMNLFLVMNGVLITPRSNDNILEGITRNTVVELAKDLGIPVEARKVARTELYVCDELFFTGTAAQIAYVGSVDNRPVGNNGARGPVTTQLQELYSNMVKGLEPRYQHWLTPVKHTHAIRS